MKRIVVLLLMLIFAFSGCKVFFVSEPPNQSEEYNYATDVNGELVPVHENVSESTLDPRQFSFDQDGRVIYSDPEISLIHGIDVSVFQGDIDWNKVKADGIDFAMIRIGFRGYGTQGKMQIDNNFYRNYSGAVAAGLKVGVYFYSQAINAAEAREEAAFILNTLGDRELSFPIAYDWEYVDVDGARTALMTSSQITECANAFCDEIMKSGREVIIYFNREIGYFEYELSVIDHYDFWLAEYYEYPSFIYEYKIWQYTDKGIVDGIEGNVDLNVSLVDYSENSDSFG